MAGELQVKEDLRARCGCIGLEMRELLHLPSIRDDEEMLVCDSRASSVPCVLGANVHLLSI